MVSGERRTPLVLIPIGIGLFGAAISLWYGRQGLLPLDSSIVFDGAWRRLCAQAYFTDFSTPSGFAPIAIQTVFFKLFGVNWLAYCLHAAVFNGLFGLIVYDLLHQASGPRWLAASYAALSTVLFYPPMGVPYLEQHAFFFLLLTVWLIVVASHATGSWRDWGYLAAPTAVLLSILSKQNPGLLAVPVAGLAAGLWVPMKHWLRAAGWLVLGLIPAGLVFVIVIGWHAGIVGEFWSVFWARPRGIAQVRLAGWTYGPLDTIRDLMWLPLRVLVKDDIVYPCLIYSPVVIWPLARWFQAGRGIASEPPPPFRLLALAAGLLTVSSVFIRLTFNQDENGIPLTLVAVGLGHIFWREWLEETARRHRAMWTGLQAAGMALSTILVLYAVFATWQFDRQVDATRMVLDFPSTQPYQPHPAQPRYLGFLDYQAPYYYAALHPDALIDFFKEHNENFLLYGDLTILYGLTGRPSVTPYLWLHEGLTIPRASEPDFLNVDTRLRDNLARFNVRYVVFEHPTQLVFMGTPFQSFSQTYAAVMARQPTQLRVGGFFVWDLGAR